MSDPLMAHQALEETLATGEVLTQDFELWQETLEFLAENGVETREDLERLVFEGTQEDNTIGLLEEVVLATAFWESLEHIDINNDDVLSQEEWNAVDLRDVPMPSTPESFKALLTQSNGTVVKAFSDFFEAEINYDPEGSHRWRRHGSSGTTRIAISRSS